MHVPFINIVNMSVMEGEEMMRWIMDWIGKAMYSSIRGFIMAPSYMSY